MSSQIFGESHYILKINLHSLPDYTYSLYFSFTTTLTNIHFNHKYIKFTVSSL